MRGRDGDVRLLAQDIQGCTTRLKRVRTRDSALNQFVNIATKLAYDATFAFVPCILQDVAALLCVSQASPSRSLVISTYQAQTEHKNQI